MKKLLFVGNPTILGENLGNVLKSNYNTDFISIRPKQIGNIRFSSYNALILDFTMLHKYSLTICKAAKKCCPNIIVLFLCPTSVPEQIILDFYEAGATDHLYISLSSPALLSKKLDILFANNHLATKYEDSHITLNFNSLTAVIEGTTTSFTPLEFKLLKLLSLSPNTVLTRQHLLYSLCLCYIRLLSIIFFYISCFQYFHNSFLLLNFSFICIYILMKGYSIFASRIAFHVFLCIT